MAQKIFVNGKEVEPGKKVKLDKQGVRPNDAVRAADAKKEAENG